MKKIFIALLLMLMQACGGDNFCYGPVGLFKGYGILEANGCAVAPPEVGPFELEVPNSKFIKCGKVQELVASINTERCLQTEEWVFITTKEEYEGTIIVENKCNDGLACTSIYIIKFEQVE